MRLVLPGGYKHVIDIEADLTTTCCHVIVDDGVRRQEGQSRLPAREARTLCGLELTLGGDPVRYGTMRDPEMDRLAYYPGTCASCAYALASWCAVDSKEDLDRGDVIRLAWNEKGEWAPKVNDPTAAGS
jgi:hypothetical protein